MLGGGMNALRGHSNIQGLTDLGLMSNLLPGYLNLPTEKEPDYESYMEKQQFKPLRPGQTSYWQNYGKFFVSFQKAMYGAAATKDNDWAYDWLPKLDVPSYDVMRAFELADEGKMTGYVIQGFNPLMTFPNRAKMTAALSKLKFIVVMDPSQTETARFWENHGDYNPVDPNGIQTEVFELPTTCFAEDEGSLSNSSRWLQWHWPAQDPPYEARTDIDIMTGALYPPAGSLSQGRRRIPGSHPASELAIRVPGESDPGRAGAGDQRLHLEAGERCLWHDTSRRSATG
jgi:formate dehydrogenase major subunit